LASDNAKVMEERGIVLVPSLDPDFIRSAGPGAVDCVECWKHTPRKSDVNRATQK